MNDGANTMFFTRTTSIACLSCILMWFSNANASSKYFLAGFGSPPDYQQTKYATAADACIALKNETEAIHLSAPHNSSGDPPPGSDPITGTYTFIQWPDENMPPGFSSECIYTFTGQNASGSVRYVDEEYLGHVLAEGCNSGQIFDPTSGTCVDVGYFLFAQLPSRSEPSSCPANAMGDPINPADGAVTRTEGDCKSIPGTKLAFGRFYNSGDVENTAADISNGWRHSYSRNVVVRESTGVVNQYVQSPDYSSQYADPATACTSGFPQIQSRVPQWSGALASYSNGNCVLTKNGKYIGTVSVNSTGGASDSAPQPVAYDVVRDDGQLIRFIIYTDGTVVAPPGIGLRLQQTSTGFTITDASDNVEQYDANGKLLTVTSRGGVVQTMNYDSANHLSSVVDSFGHQLTFSYDAQGHLSSVARQ